MVPTDEGLASDYDSDGEAEEEESDDQTDRGLHYEDWCEGSFDVFITPTSLPCSHCRKKAGKHTKFGICETCRAMACGKCIEDVGHIAKKMNSSSCATCSDENRR